MSDGAAHAPLAEQIRWRGTFIEVVDGSDDWQHSLRKSASDPDLRSDRSDKSLPEKTYCESLSDRLSQIWNASADNAQRRESSSVASNDSGDETRRKLNERTMATRFGFNLDYGGSMTPAHKTYVVATADAARQAAALTAPIPSRGVTQTELKWCIHTQVKEISRKLHWQQRREVLSAIEELPEQVEEALHQSATTIFHEVQDKVAVLQKIMRQKEPGQPDQVEEAVERLEGIPNIMWGSLEANVAKVKTVVQQRIDGVLEDMDKNGVGPDTSEEIVQLMRALPAEAGTVIQQAVTDSSAHAQQLFDNVIQNLPEESQELSEAVLRAVERGPKLADAAETVAWQAAAQPTEQAVAVVREQSDVAGAVVNQVVADMLLRAKATPREQEVAPLLAHVGVLGGSDHRGSAARESRKAFDAGGRARPLAEAAVAGSASRLPRDGPAGLKSGMGAITNPGSVGHPEFCPRPCLYFSTGACVNGGACVFCHFPHSRRPAHLDKRHRDYLRRMPLADCAALILPILLEKVRQCDETPKSLALLRQIATECGAHDFIDKIVPPSSSASVAGSAGSATSSAQARSERLLMVALRAMSCRLLMASLHRSCSDAGKESACRRLDDLLDHLRRR